MLLQTLKNYWLTVCAGSMLVGSVLAFALYIGFSTVSELSAAHLRSNADAFAKELSRPSSGVEALLTGLSRTPDAETRLKRAASLAGAKAFAVFDREGREVFRTRSERYEWLLRDRPGGMVTGDRLSPAVLERSGEWSIVHRSANDTRWGLAPLRREGETIGYVSVDSDLTGSSSALHKTVFSALSSVLMIVLVATGVPLLVYIRRKRRMAEAARRIDFLANHDSLTGLWNRGKMQEETDRTLVLARATRERMAYLHVDLDDLSEINNELGQAAGDEFLQTVAGRLAALVDQDDLLARIGSDDFAILHRRMATVEELESLATRIHSSVCEETTIKGKAITPRLSIGCAVVPEDGRTHSELVKRAEVAHYHHKSAKGRALVFFEAAMDQATDQRRHVEASLRHALETDGFELHFQPIVDGDGNNLLGFEALARLRDEEGREISPSVFIPIAEARGHIKAIGTWVIRQAVWQLSQWPEELFVSVNLSAVQFGDGDLVQIVEDALTRYGVDGRRLELEVVESLMLERSQTILDQLHALKGLGVAIDMDDFGTGYSSLGYLWRFPFDKLKIDRSFMLAQQRGEPNVPQIIETIVSMAHHLGMKVTTEGAETEEQIDLLRRLGSDQIQGFYFGRPAPAEAVAAEVFGSFHGNRCGRGAAPSTPVGHAPQIEAHARAG